MKNAEMFNAEEFYTLRERIVDYAYSAFASVALFSLVFSVFRAVQFGGTLIFYVTILITTLLLIVAFNKKKVSLSTKTWLLISGSSLTLFSGMYSFGFLASSTLYIVVVPVCVSFVMPLRTAIKSLVLHFSIYILFAFLYCTSVLTITVEPLNYLSSISVWLLDATIIIFCTWSLVAVGQAFIKTLNDKFLKIEEQNIKLASNERKYRLLFETSNDAIILIRERKFFDCNQKTFDLFACDSSFILGRGPTEFSPEFQYDGEASDDKAKRLFDLAYNGFPQIFDWRHVRPDGTYFDCSISLNLVQLDDEQYFQAVLRDVTVQKQQDAELQRHREQLEILVAERTEELAFTNDELVASNEELVATNDELYFANNKIQNQHRVLEDSIKQLKMAQSLLIQSEKMASLGILTAGVAHEINNPLNFIMGAQVGLERYFEEIGQLDSPRIVSLMHSLNSGLERAASIVASLNQFSRDRNLKSEHCNITEIINNCLLVLGNKMDSDIILNRNYTDEIMIVDGNMGDLHQVFINIINNAFLAIDTAGAITIQIEHNLHSIVVIISDTGCGMDQETIAHIFDPFFTTREPGEGTGLGMSIAYNIIEEHGGSIKYISELNQGSTVIVTLPVAKGM